MKTKPMRRIIQHILITNSLILALAIPLSAQDDDELLVNPSLDGVEMQDTVFVYKPNDWETCYNKGTLEDSWNDPNFDSCKFFAGTQHCNIDGENFCLLRTRGDNYSYPERAGTYEHISSKLIHPLTENSTYNFSIWLIAILKWGVNDMVEPDTAFPIRFQIFGADEYCKAKENDILIDELITNTEWKEYTFNFCPTRDYEYIYFRVYWDDQIRNQKGWRYNGMILLDNSSLKLKYDTNYIYSDTVYYTDHPRLQLNAPDGSLYQWDPPYYLSENRAQSTLITSYFDSVKVTFRDTINCQTEKNYIILFSCDTLFPENRYKEHFVYYKTYEDNVLTASDEVSFHWHDSLSLTSIDTRSTVITDYKHYFDVTLTDIYGCEYDEQFNLLLDCNYLYDYPINCSLEGSTIAYRCSDTTLKTEYGSTIELNARLPELLGLDYDALQNYNWNPSDYLDLSRIQDFGADLNAKESVTYLFEYTDTFNCSFYETFNIELAFRIPNVITPGTGKTGDGKNDRFCIPELPEGSSIQIFSKIGLKVFEANPYNYTNWWDGTDMDGRPVHSGTYWYVLIIGNAAKPLKGFVLVVR